MKPEEHIIRGRRVGNTTRQIDYEIQLLFTTGETSVWDHAQTNTNYAFQEHFRILVGRLYNEHGLHLQDGLIWDREKKTLKIKNYDKENNT